MLKRFAVEAADAFRQNGQTEQELQALRLYRDIVERTARGDLIDVPESDRAVVELFSMVEVRPIKAETARKSRRGRKKKSADDGETGLQTGGGSVGDDSGSDENV